MSTVSMKPYPNKSSQSTEIRDTGDTVTSTTEHLVCHVARPSALSNIGILPRSGHFKNKGRFLTTIACDTAVPEEQSERPQAALRTILRGGRFSCA